MGRTLNDLKWRERVLLVALFMFLLAFGPVRWLATGVCDLVAALGESWKLKKPGNGETNISRAHDG